MKTIDNRLTGNGQKPIPSIMQQTDPQLLPLIMNNIPQAVFWKDRDLVYLGCNQAFAEDAGLSSPEAIIGKTDFDMPWKEQAELYRADDRQVMEKGEPKLNYEEPQTTPNGSRIWLSTSKIPVYENDRVVAVLGMYEDITGRKQAEALLQSMIESAPEAVGIIDLTTGLFTEPNENAVKLYGLSREELVKVGPAQMSPLVQPDGCSSAETAMEKINLAMQGETPVFEWTHRNARGEDIPCEVRLARLPGEPPKVRFSVTNITERKRVERMLNESEERYRRLSEATVEGIVIHDKGILLDANEVFAAMFGYKLSEVIGMAAVDFLTPETREITAQNIRSGYEKPYEVMGLRKDGSTFPVEITGKSFPYEGRTVRVTALRDVTERKRLEQEIQAAFERRGRQVQLSTQVSQAIAAATNLEDLYQRVVTQVKEQFGYYHTQILRYDAMQDAVVLVTGYGEAGQKMLDAGHHLPMGKGLIGTAADTGETVLRSTLENDPDWQSHPLLPDTKGEIAVPIKLGNNILGVLDVQSNVAGALDIDDKLLLEGLCGQIAVAMESTRLSQEMAERLKEINRLYRAMSREGWQTYGDTENIPRGFMFDQGGLRQVEESTLADELFANVPLTVPGGEVIGTLAIADDPQRPISPEDKVFLQQVSEQVALALESARLFEQTQSALATTQESEERLSEALNIAKLAHWEYDVERDRFTFNEQFYSIFHTTAEKVGGYELSSGEYAQLFVHPEDAPLVGTEIGKALSSTERHYTVKLEHRILFADGGVGYISVEVHVERDESGKITRFYGANQDITERKKAELAIQESEERLSEALDIARLAHWEYDVEKDIFTFNDHFYSIFHTTAEKVGGYLLSSGDYARLFVHPEDVPVVGTEIGKALASTDQHYSAKLEHRILYADGQIGYLAVDIHIERDENGKIIRYYGANQDITERKKAEEIVRESEARLSEALNIAKLANWEYDFERDKFIFNDHFYSIFHATAEQVGGYELSSAEYTQLFVHPDDAAIVGTEIGKAVASTDRHYITKLEHRILFADGGAGYISADVHIERDENGKITRWYGANQDITERKRAEESIKAEQQRAQTILETVNVPMIISRLSDSIILYANHALSQFRHVPLEELIGARTSDYFVNPDDRVRLVGALQQKGQTTDFETQLKRNDGTISSVLLSARVINYQNELCVLTTYVDITDRIRAEESTAKRAAELQTVAEVSTTTATTLEPDRLLQAVVDLTKEQFNLYHAHIYVADESWNTLLLAAGAGEVGRAMVADNWSIPLDHPSSIVAAAAQNKKSIIANDVRRDKDSGFLSNRLLPDTRSEMAVPMIVGEKVLGVFDVQSDIADHFTEEDVNIYTTLAAQVAIALQNARLYVEQTAAVSQLRELDRLKSSFLANMSHELRTPLNSILGFTDVMLEGLDGNLTDYMDNDLRLIQKNGQHLLHLINDVLDMAKIESGRMNLHPETFKVHSVLEEVTSITSTLASEKNLALFIEENSDQELKIYADNTRLRQVMINLVNNSIKFTEKGNISICAKPMDGARVLISVKDTGIGIPPEQLEAIFQEFTQVDTSSTRKAGGTGLGLPISRRLVEMHGGRLWAESTGIDGEGSIFYVEMPVEARISEVIEKQEK